MKEKIISTKSCNAQKKKHRIRNAAPSSRLPCLGIDSHVMLRIVTQSLQDFITEEQYQKGMIASRRIFFFIFLE
jgi:hypothetical protein